MAKDYERKRKKQSQLDSFIKKSRPNENNTFLTAAQIKDLETQLCDNESKLATHSHCEPSSSCTAEPSTSNDTKGDASAGTFTCPICSSVLSDLATLNDHIDTCLLTSNS